MRRLLAILPLFFVLVLGYSGATRAAAPPIVQKPFATHHIVLQISDGSAQKQTLVLNVAGNLMRYYGAANLDLEVVAFGPGLRLLLANNVNRRRIRELASNFDVKFDACGMTLKSFTRRLGYRPRLVPQATVVPGGAVRIARLVKHGYVLIRP